MENDSKILRVGEIIRHYDMTQQEFSKIIGVNQSNLSKILSGKRACGDYLLNAILVSFDINKDWLFEGRGSMLRTVEKKLNIDGTINESAKVERLKLELQFAQKQLEQLESTIGDKGEIIALLKDKLAKKERDIKELTEQCAHLLNQLTSNNI